MTATEYLTYRLQVGVKRKNNLNISPLHPRMHIIEIINTMTTKEPIPAVEYIDIKNVSARSGTGWLSAGRQNKT